MIDIFDPTFDWTVNTSGNAMNSLYMNALKKYKGKSQYEVFLDVTKKCKNVVVLAGDSKKLTIPSKHICFGFIDGNHAPDYVENDFTLIWNALTSNGAVAFHDYEGDLPQTTAKINELANKHSAEIKKKLHNKNKNILFIIKN